MTMKRILQLAVTLVLGVQLVAPGTASADTNVGYRAGQIQTSAAGEDSGCGTQKFETFGLTGTSANLSMDDCAASSELGSASSSSRLEYRETWQGADLLAISAKGNVRTSAAASIGTDSANCCQATGKSNYTLVFSLSEQRPVRLSGSLTETTNGPSDPCVWIVLNDSTTAVFSQEGPGGPQAQTVQGCSDANGSSTVSFSGTLPAGSYGFGLLAETRAGANGVEDSDNVPSEETTAAAFDVSVTFGEGGGTGLSITDVPELEGHEGQTPFTFQVSLPQPATQTVTVRYGTSGGNAQAGSDYNVESGSLSFSPGDQSKTVTVQVRGDETKESHETFKVKLSNAQGATIGDGTGLGTILDDDNCTINGTSAAETLNGTAGDDVICGRGGNDTINGLAGDDVIAGGNGNDTISGGPDRDRIDGGDGEDNICGDDQSGGTCTVGSSDDNDFIEGGPGDDTALEGGPGADRLFGGGGKDNLAGGVGADALRGGGGRDLMCGDDSVDLACQGSSTDGDTMTGDDGNDEMLGGDGNDIMLGSAGTDTMQGNGGNDTVRGEADDDTINGGPGTDTLEGGSHSDSIDACDNDTQDTVHGGFGFDTAELEQVDIRTSVQNELFCSVPI